MSEVPKKIKSEVDKEAIKKWLKAQLTHPYDSEARKQEIDYMVEESARCADFIEAVANSCGMDLDEFVLRIFGIKF